MTLEQAQNSVKYSSEDYNTLRNQILLSLAQRESVIKKWTAPSSHLLPPAKNQEEFDAEDASLFQNQPPHLGVGAQITSDFSMSEIDRNDKSLRTKLLGSKSSATKKVKDTRERVDKPSRDDYSDDELGRSSIGKMKKQNLDGPPIRQTGLSQKKTTENTGKISDTKLVSCSSQSPSPAQAGSKYKLATSGLEFIGKDCNERSNLPQIAAENSLANESNLDQGVKVENSLVNPCESSKPEISTDQNKFRDREDIDEKKRRKKREKKKRQKLRAKSLKTTV